MYKKLIFLMVVLGVVNSAWAAYLQVDIVYPIQRPLDPNHLIRNERTSEPGWYKWAATKWRDLSYHDPVWAATGGGYDPAGIEGSGVDIWVSCGYEGDTSLKVLGLNFVDDGKEPNGVPPSGDNEIANSYIVSHRHWGDEPNAAVFDPNDANIPPRGIGRPSFGSIFLRLRGGGLVKGDYTLTTYHNCPNNIDRDRQSQYFPPDWYPDPNLEGRVCDVMPWIKVGGAGVTPKVMPENVPIQHETTDANLVPVVTKFYYNGVEDVNIWICSPYGGDGRIGGAAFLNALILEGGDPNMATFPRPGSGAVNIHPTGIIVWRPGINADKHDVYFSSDFNDVNNGIALVGDNQDANEYDPPGNLTLGKTYYWRIDEVNGVKVWPGMVWKFTIDDGKAKDPNIVLPGLDPGLPQSKTLAWKPGTFATSHDLYFGADFNDVNDANTSSPEFISNFVMTPGNDANIYQIPYLLTLGESYYWRVDEHNSVYGDSKGNIWSFQIRNYLIVDDFESYNEMDNLVTDTWKDGVRLLPPPYYFEFVNGALIGLSYSKAEPAQPAKDTQGLGYSYMNDGSLGTPYYSEAEREFEPPVDWTLYNIKALVLYFYGDPNADANVPYNQMYMRLGDKTQKKVHRVDYGYYGGQDMNDILEQEWHEWNLDLQDFADAGVDITDVNKIIIGFGDRDSLVPGGTGEIFFDDIRLYLSRCVPSILKPFADLSGNCKVDMADVVKVLDDWLLRDFTVTPVVPPTGPVLRYQFEETSGSTANDSSGNGYHAPAVDSVGSSVTPYWTAGGKTGRCIMWDNDLENDYVLVVPNGSFNNHIVNQITVSAWLKWDQNLLDSGSGVLISVSSGTVEAFKVMADAAEDSDEISVNFRDRVHAAGGSTELWSPLEWNHLACVKNVPQKKMQVYINGKMVGENSTATGPIDFSAQPATLIRMGAATERWTDAYTGYVDDFRLYNYAMSQEQIAYLVTGGAPLYVPLESDGDLWDGEPANSKAVNFKDYTIIVNDWFDEVSWP